MNLQNDRLYVASVTRKKHVPAERLVKTCSNFLCIQQEGGHFAVKQ